MKNTLRRLRRAVSGVALEDRSTYKRVDLSLIRYDESPAAGWPTGYAMA